MDIFWGMSSAEEVSWGGLIALYLFLAGIAGGAFLTASLTDLFNKNRPAGLIKTGATIAPLAIIVGLGLLVLDLGNPFSFWKLLIYTNTNSVMSIGTFIISIFVSLAFVYAYLIWTDSTGRFAGLRKPVALLGALFALCTATYTGFLLSAITANALWSVSFLGLIGVPFLSILFLISAVSTGLAATLMGAGKSEGLGLYKKLDIVLIILEVILLLVLYFTVNPIYFSGSMAALFWIGVVVIGLMLPLTLAVYGLYKHRHWVIPVYGGVILGGLCLRYFIVYSGQMF